MKDRVLNSMVWYGRLAVLILLLVGFCVPLRAQTEEVQHVHGDGGLLHAATLSVTPDGLLIRTQSTIRSSNGFVAYCTLPTIIRFNQIVAVEAREFKWHFLSNSDGRVAQLHLEVRDEHGKSSTYTFVSGTASHDERKMWHEGKDGGTQAKRLAQSLQAAMARSLSASNHASDANPSGIASPGATDATKSYSETASPESVVSSKSLDVTRSGQAEGSSNDPATSPRAGAPTDASRLAHFDVQLSGPNHLNKVTVWPISASDPNYLLIYWPESSGNQIVRLDDILKAEVKQRTLEFANSNAGAIIQIGGPKKPKLSELLLEVRQSGDKKFAYHFVSDSATCQGEAPCREGVDGGQHVHELADAIHSAIDARTAAREREIEEETEQRARPSKLVATVRYDDSHSFLPDSRIDPGKRGELVVNVENDGPGTAYKVVTAATVDQHTVSVDGGKSLGDLSPGQKREVRLPVFGGLNLSEGVATIRIGVQEQDRGYAAAPVEITIPTVRLRPPRLSIEDRIIVNDANSGFAQGNGNGKAENGEKVEFLLSVRNDGPGPAMGVVLLAADVPPGISPIHLSDEIGLIAPGDRKQGKLAFAIPRNWSESSIQFHMKVSDVRGDDVAVASRNFVLEVGTLKTGLSASMRLFAKGRESTEFTNDETNEIEVVVRNDGDMEAEDVVLHVSTPGSTIAPSVVNLGNISPHDARTSSRIRFSLPRSFPADHLVFAVEMSQKDFAAVAMSQQFVVQRHQPNLRTSWGVLHASDNRSVERGQPTTLELALENEGSLTASEVVVRIIIHNANIKELSPTAVNVGTVPAGSKRQVQFSLLIGNSVPLGQLPIQASLSQADFPTLTEAVPLEVRDEPVQVVHVAPPPAPVFAREHEISGVVRTADAAPVPGVKVSMENGEGTVTDDTGGFRLRLGLSQEPGDRIKLFVRDWVLVKPADGETLVPRDSSGPLVIVVRRSPVFELGLDDTLASELHSDTALTLDGTSVKIVGSAENSTIELLGDHPPSNGMKTLGVKSQGVISKVLAWYDGRTLSKFERPYSRSYAVLVAIDDYDRRKDPKRRGSTGFAPLGKMVANAEALKTALLKLGFPEQNIVTLYDERAESTDVDDVLRSFWMGGQRSAADRVFFYFGGHGTSYKGEGLLVTYDYDASRRTRTSILMGDLTGHYSTNIEANHLLIALDACSAGLALNVLGNETQERHLLKNPRTLSIIRNDVEHRARNVLLAGTGDQSAVYDNGGIFTQALIRGLADWKADLNGDGIIEFKELAAYVEDEVAFLAYQQHSDQKPGSYKLSSGGADGEVVFLKEGTQ